MSASEASRTFRLSVAYDGTAFHGWQVQPGLRTVQGAIETALREVVEEEGIRVHGAGRTDAGVHARGQGASFRAHTTLPAHALEALIGRGLPGDVRVFDVREVPAEFHARHSARARRYTYRLLAADDVLLGRFAWHPGRPSDRDALSQTAATVVGEHDFAAFESSGSSDVDPVCRVRGAAWREWEGGLRFDIVADHFLYHMVRNLVATMLRASRTSDPAAALAKVLASRDRARAAGTAPARGLCLEQVAYEGQAIEC